MPSTDSNRPAHFWNLETRLASALSILAGFVGAAVYVHSIGYFVTFMTGNTERSVLGNFAGDHPLALGAAAIIACFLVGVFVASLSPALLVDQPPARRDHAHHRRTAGRGHRRCRARGAQPGPGPDSVRGLRYGIAQHLVRQERRGLHPGQLHHRHAGEVRAGRRTARGRSGGNARDWLGYATQYLSFGTGALIGGLVSIVVDGSYMLNAALAGSLLVAAYTWRADIRWVRRNARLVADGD